MSINQTLLKAQQNLVSREYVLRVPALITVKTENITLMKTLLKKLHLSGPALLLTRDLA